MKKVDTGETISKVQKHSATKAYRTFSSVTMVHSSPCGNLNSLQKTMDLTNSEVEPAVRTKEISNKTKDEYFGLLSYRNKPLKNGYSPVQLNMGRSIISCILCHLDELKPCTPVTNLVCKKEKEYRKQMQTIVTTKPSRRLMDCPPATELGSPT